MIRTVGRFVKTSSVSVVVQFKLHHYLSLSAGREGHEVHSCRKTPLQVIGTAESRALPRRSKHRVAKPTSCAFRNRWALVAPKKSGLEQSGETTQVQGPQNYFCDAMAWACSALRICERVVSLMLTPCFGRRVKLGTSTTGCPGTVPSWNFWAMVARSKVASIMANEDPMHCLGPPPNGKYAKRGSFWERPGIQRSGSNFSGSGK
jgi:hypothetical protein